jgi:hypothetical protein
MADGMTVDMQGMDTFVNLLDGLSPRFARRVQTAVKRAAKDCYDDSQAIVPVGKDTMVTLFTGPGQMHVAYSHIAGTLKGSGKITYEGDITMLGDFWAIVSYGGDSSTGEYCDYAVYVELGTRKMAAEPYLLPSYEYAKIILLIDAQGIATLNGIV